MHRAVGSGTFDPGEYDLQPSTRHLLRNWYIVRDMVVKLLRRNPSKSFYGEESRGARILMLMAWIGMPHMI